MGLYFILPASARFKKSNLNDNFIASALHYSIAMTEARVAGTMNALQRSNYFLVADLLTSSRISLLFLRYLSSVYSQNKRFFFNTKNNRSAYQIFAFQLEQIFNARNFLSRIWRKSYFPGPISYIRHATHFRNTIQLIR